MIPLLPRRKSVVLVAKEPTMKKIIAGILFLSILLLTVSCFPEAVPLEQKPPANFLKGIWHGWIAPISLIVSLFNDNVRIYQVNNTGWWYDAGFYIAVISGFGGLSLKRRHKKDNE